MVRLVLALCIASLLFGNGSSWAMTPAQLKQLLVNSAPPTIIDLRSTSLYQRGHIPGAISIPATLLPHKKLPALGRVIVYGEGLGRDNPALSVAQLNRLPGVKAEELEGGFAGWESANGTTTRAKGIQNEELPWITYQQLKQAHLEEMVLVDLRDNHAAALQSVQGQEPPPLTDLRQEFPGARIAHSAFDLPSGLAASSTSVGGPVLVLIDAGDGQAQATARLLKANGQKRFVILAGGELILARKGQPGLQRSGVGGIPQVSAQKP